MGVLFCIELFIFNFLLSIFIKLSIDWMMYNKTMYTKVSFFQFICSRSEDFLLDINKKLRG